MFWLPQGLKKSSSTILQNSSEFKLKASPERYSFWLGSFTLQTYNKPLKHLFAPVEEISKTASARITRWPHDFDSGLKYTPEKQIAQADALSMLELDDNSDENN